MILAENEQQAGVFMGTDGKILVTGGAGFIGSHTAVALLDAGYEIVVADNFHNAKRDMPGLIARIAGRTFDFYEADIRDEAAFSRIFSEQDIAAVIHFAGYKAVGESVHKPLEYYENNVGGAIALLRAMRAAGCARIVFSSSATVYGMDNPVPYREEYPTSATNPYGYTKVVIERILEDLCVAEPSWSAVLLRYFNPVGAHQSGLIGEDPNDIPNNLMPYVAQVAAGLRPELSVFGDDYPTVDGTGVRDYIHVVDLAQGHIAALNYALGHTGAEAVNLGTGSGTSVLELVRAFEKASGRKVPYRVTGRRAGDIAECYADTRRAQTLLGWTARRGLDEMCRDAWNFAKTRYNVQ